MGENSFSTGSQRNISILKGIRKKNSPTFEQSGSKLIKKQNYLGWKTRKEGLLSNACRT
jgi:hypothetical protein